MEPRIPLPTDNIYKFYALLGLLLIVFIGGALLYVNQAANDKVFTLAPQLEGLKQIQQPTAEEKTRITILERSLEISKSDKIFFMQALGVIGGIAIWIAAFGFFKWEKHIQPIQDKISKAQLELAELQLIKLKRELGLDDRDEVSTTQPKQEPLTPIGNTTSPSTAPLASDANQQQHSQLLRP